VLEQIPLEQMTASTQPLTPGPDTTAPERIIRAKHGLVPVNFAEMWW
jgi:hypothetical protein